MKINELRFGNYLHYRDKERVLTVSNLGSFGFETVCSKTGVVYGSDDISDYNGIQLTDINLSDLNFDYSHWATNWILNEIPIPTKIDYLHQLQNLYFALTGQELTLNE